MSLFKMWIFTLQLRSQNSKPSASSATEEFDGKWCFESILGKDDVRREEWDGGRRFQSAGGDLSNHENEIWEYVSVLWSEAVAGR